MVELSQVFRHAQCIFSPLIKKQKYLNQTWNVADGTRRVLNSAIAGLDAHAQIQLLYSVETPELFDPIGAVWCIYDHDKALRVLSHSVPHGAYLAECEDFIMLEQP